MKYSKAKIKEVKEYIEENGLMYHGGSLLKDFCKAMDITQETFYQWMKITEFSEVVENARKVFKLGLEQRIVASLAKTATGYEWTQTNTEYINVEGKKVIKKQNVKKIHESPNVGAGIFLLTNIAPERWKNTQNHELSGELSTGLNIVVENKEDKELIEKLGDLE